MNTKLQWIDVSCFSYWFQLIPFLLYSFSVISVNTKFWISTTCDFIASCVNYGSGWSQSYWQLHTHGFAACNMWQSIYTVHYKLTSTLFPSRNSWYLYTDCFEPQQILMHTQLVMCWSLGSYRLKHISVHFGGMWKFFSFSAQLQSSDDHPLICKRKLTSCGYRSSYKGNLDHFMQKLFPRSRCFRLHEELGGGLGTRLECLAVSFHFNFSIG